MRAVVLLFCAAMIFASACNKKHCWGCRVILYDTFRTAYRDTFICDKTRKEINSLKDARFDASQYGYEFFAIETCGMN